MTTNDVSDTRISAERLKELILKYCQSYLTADETAAFRELLASRHPQPVNEPAEWQVNAALAAAHKMGAVINRPTMLTALRAASIPAPERSKEETGVRIKPLEWEGEKGGPGRDIRAIVSPVMSYTVRHLDVGVFDVILNTDTGQKWFRHEGQLHASYAKAKAAAQADYEQRILSALETPPLHKEGEAVATDRAMRGGEPCGWPECGCDFDAKCSDAPAPVLVTITPPMREVMWAEVIFEGEDNRFLWACDEDSNMDGVHHEMSIELSADTFPEGTRLVVMEPDTEAAALSKPTGEV